ncbi:hypothetical protein P261_02380 [Lachnospiraceae bacterium TWA4]|nr:hypothetical protein P261_02380 [Lachnospiraceae bacterium TWA4]
MSRPKIKITLIDKKGEKGCHRGHKIGDTYDYDTERGKLCPMAMHCGFPYIDILRYGGHVPGNPDKTAVFCCSDADVINVFKVEIVEESTNHD